MVHKSPNEWDPDNGPVWIRHIKNDSRLNQVGDLRATYGVQLSMCDVPSLFAQCPGRKREEDSASPNLGEVYGKTSLASHLKLNFLVSYACIVVCFVILGTLVSHFKPILERKPTYWTGQFVKCFAYYAFGYSEDVITIFFNLILIWFILVYNIILKVGRRDTPQLHFITDILQGNQLSFVPVTKHSCTTLGTPWEYSFINTNHLLFTLILLVS